MPDSVPAFLEIRGISKAFPGVVALADVSISLRRGEIHALVGENGAGKSTLMNVLAGLLSPDRGEIRKDGVPLPFGDPVAALRRGIGTVPQELTLVPRLTAAENIFLGSLPKSLFGLKVDWRIAGRRAAAVLQTIDPGIDPAARVGDLGVAKQQLVQIARAMAFKADILVFDEPTASLTYRETDKLFDLILSFKAGGGSCFYISHRLEEIQRLCDRVSILRDGRLVRTGAVASLSTREIINLMVGREALGGPCPPAAERAERGIALRAVSLSRAGEFADASFHLGRGEILGFAGLMGAGRTELMKCVAGDTRPDSGEIFVGAASRPVRFGHPCQAIRMGIAYLPEERRNYGIFPLMTVSENMSIANLGELSAWWGIRRRREAARVQDMIGRLLIKTPSRLQRIRNLSGGNQQKVIVARWLMRGCPVLILDEPTRGIDVKAKREIHDLLRRIRGENGVSVIIVSSELQELLDACDRIVVMHEGRIKGEIRPGPEVSQSDIMKIALA
ncbi:MAG: sugar ABC transporter ATP-binding protein [Planctomycetota bacterium]|jgi:ABC-type sugar transport system ATPase subunit|nr:sugar ABC transporter ATP-binding protein [Planctomycetota bacterium]